MFAGRTSGYSLAEVLIACAVLAVGAAVALPTMQPVVEVNADTVAGDIVRALRFTRQEAMRAGALRMLGCDQPNNRLAVYIPDKNGVPVSLLQDPLRKTDYLVQLDQSGGAGRAAIASCSFVFTDKNAAVMLGFDADGNPVRGTGDAAKQAMAMTGGSIVVAIDGAQRTVTVDVTGRVTVS